MTDHPYRAPGEMPCEHNGKSYSTDGRSWSCLTCPAVSGPPCVDDGTFLDHTDSPNFIPPALAKLAARGYRRINVVNEPWNDGTTRPKPLGPAELRACWCFECLNAPEHGLSNPTLSRMILCPACGNKRCPRATDHRYACTGSNEAGQFGSRYDALRPTAAKPKEPT